MVEWKIEKSNLVAPPNPSRDGRVGTPTACGIKKVVHALRPQKQVRNLQHMGRANVKQDDGRRKSGKKKR